MDVKKFIIILIVCIAEFASAQSFNLKGKITDAENGSSIQGATVFISYGSFAYSNAEGFYSLSGLNAGKYHIKISSLGYKSVSTEIEINSDKIKDFILTPSTIELDEVVVSTNRTENYLRNSPFAESLVGKEEIQTRPSFSLPDILQNEPGVSLLRDGIWGTEVSIRGLNRENVITLIDGNRIATSTDVAARLSMVDINNVERVEVIKGASSSIYGSGATGGIVNIITKSPQLYDRFSLNGNVISEYNTVNNLSVFGGSVYSGSSLWSTKLSGSYRKANNIQTPNGELNNSQFEDYSFSGALNIFPIENHKLKIDYQLFRADNVGIPGSSVFPEQALVTYPFERRELISAGYEIQNISKAFYKLSAKYSYQLINRDVENIPYIVQNIPASGGNPARRVSVLKITPSADHKNNNATLQGNFWLFDSHNLAAGIDYWDRSYNGERERYQLIEVLDSAGNVVSTTNRITGEKPLPNSSYKSLGIFAQDEFKLFEDKLSTTLGLRYDFINITGEKTLNPVYVINNGVINTTPPNQQVIWDSTDENNSSYSANLGFIYSLFSNFDLTLGLGSSFRSPSLEERFQYIDQGSVVRVGNPDLEPEKGQSIDLGIRHYSDNLKILSSFFYSHFNDLVVEVPGTYEGRNALIKTNIGEARIYGFDFSADYNFWRDYIFYTTASYVKGDDITADGNLPEIPPLNGRVGFKFGFLNYFQTDISSTLFAEQNNVAEDELTTPGYAVFNLLLNTVPIIFSNFSFRIYSGVENIFDKGYRNHLSTTRGSITIEPGRNIFLKLAVDF
ncbi:MAG TPA: TonB-dependent receptor [Ignavibacteriaceae bacterium]|nr:TonB-dependent receptor [Ignavibacteriaceae bacterium]